MSKDNLPIPKENLDIYILLYNIEVGLRELIIESLTTRCGPYWWKERLPPDVLEEYRKGRDYERNTKWCQLVPHHPIYYINFPHLKKIIERIDNWRDVFQPMFKRKEILTATLSELEPIRNKIAHNRKTTWKDLRIVEGVYHKIVTAIGEERFHELVSKCTLAPDLLEIFLRLRQEAERSFKCCIAYRSLEKLKLWENVKDQWWFDEGYLGCELNGIREFFSLLETYSKFPRSRGSGARIEAWVKSNNLEKKYDKAKELFSKLLNIIERG